MVIVSPGRFGARGIFLSVLRTSSMAKYGHMEGLHPQESNQVPMPESLAKYKTDLEKHLTSLGALKIEYKQKEQAETWAAAVSLAGASLAAIATEEASSK